MFQRLHVFHRILLRVAGQLRKIMVGKRIKRPPGEPVARKHQPAEREQPEADEDTCNDDDHILFPV